MKWFNILNFEDRITEIEGEIKSLETDMADRHERLSQELDEIRASQRRLNNLVA